MSRRNFLKASALFGASIAMGGLGITAVNAQGSGRSGGPLRIIMAGYGPATTSFSLALKQIGDRIEAKFKGDVEVRYVYNILDLGYRGLDILWLVEEGVVTAGYQSSSYLTDRVSDLSLIDLPFIFPDNHTARAAMDGELGGTMTASIEANTDYRILGYFENGFRHLSTRVRPARSPADLQGMSMRVLPSKGHERTFEFLGAQPEIMDLSEAIARVRPARSMLRKTLSPTPQLTVYIIFTNTIPPAVISTFPDPYFFIVLLSMPGLKNCSGK